MPLRTLLTSVLLVLLTQTAFNNGNPAATIEWEQTSIDLGTLEMNKPVVAEFVFKNPGMIPLLINDVKPSCGCTVANFPKQPIVSGSTNKIAITYDAKSEGFFSKTISVFTNTSEGITKLYIKGEVMK